MQLDQNRALVLFSGGQDSATCLAWTLARYAHVETVGFNYGQRHHVELEARTQVREKISSTFPDWGKKLGADTLVDLQSLKELGATAMTDEMAIASNETGLPNTFVPGRNLVFAVMSAALAWRRNIGTLVGGMCETDYSGYPDCRAETLEAQRQAISLGMDADFAFETPLMHLTKAESWVLAEKLGGVILVDLIVEHSHTCYLGERGKRHEWGYGCGTCPACELRAKGWVDYQNGITK